MITGRPARQALALGGLDEVGDAIGDAGRELFVFGQYGNERWTSTQRRVVSPRPPQGWRLPARAAAGAARGRRRRRLRRGQGPRGRRPHPPPRRPGRGVRAPASRGCASSPSATAWSSRARPQRDRGALAGHGQGRRRAQPGRGGRGAAASCSPATTSATSRRSRPSPSSASRACRRCWSARPPTRRAPWSSLADVVVHGPDGVLDLLRQLTADARPPGSPDDLSFRIPIARLPDVSSIVTHASMWIRVRAETASPRLGPAHREGLRERPVEVPATAASLPSGAPHGRSRERCQFRPAARVAPGKMRRRSSMSTAGHRDPSRTTHARRRVRQRPRPVVPRVRPRGRAGPALRVSGVLRPARGGLRLPGASPASEIEAGPRQHLALPGAAAGARPTSPRAPTPSPASPGCCGRTTSAASSASRSSGSRTTPPTRPTPSRTASSPAR